MKRIKTVYRNAGEVLHIWAQQNGHDVRCSNAHSDGTALYSYATPIANFVTNNKGKRAVLITTERYSVTTSQNMPTASDIPGGFAIGAWYSEGDDHTKSRLVPVFHVRHIERTGGRAPYPSSKGPHWDNMDVMREEYHDLLKKLSRAKVNAETYTKELHNLRTKAQAYAKFFGVPFVGKNFPIVSEETIARAKAVTAAEAKRKAKATAERNAHNRKAAEADAKAWLAGEVARLDWRTKQYCTPETLERINAREAQSWLEGGETLNRNQYTGPTLLRVRGEEIETSRGASFPLAHGLKALPIIRAIVASGETWQRNGKTIHLGHYQIDKIGDGVIVAGCHTLPVAEVERLAASLGV